MSGFAMDSFIGSRSRLDSYEETWMTLTGRDVVDAGVNAPVWMGHDVGLRFTIPSGVDSSTPGDQGLWQAYDLTDVLGRLITAEMVGDAGAVAPRNNARYQMRVQRTNRFQADDAYGGVMIASHSDPAAIYAAGINGKATLLEALDTAGGIAPRGREIISGGVAATATATANNTATQNWISCGQGTANGGLETNRLGFWLENSAGGAALTSNVVLVQHGLSVPAYLIAYAGADVIPGGNLTLDLLVQVRLLGNRAEFS